MDIGNTVRIKQNLLSNTLSQTGIVKEFLCDLFDEEIWCDINWDDGSTNVVRINDLDFIKPNKLNFNSIW